MVSRSSKRREIASEIGIDFALANEQKSPPGQQMMSDKKPICARARLFCSRVCHTANKSFCGTSTSEIFCSCVRSEEHTSELQSRENLVCRLLLEKKNSNRSRSSLRDRAGRFPP